MGTRSLIVITITTLVVGVLSGRYYLNTAPDALAQQQQRKVIHIIKYDVINQKVIEVTDEEGQQRGEPKQITRGIPQPLLRQGQRIESRSSIEILSDLPVSSSCTCYGNICIGTTC